MEERKKINGIAYRSDQIVVKDNKYYIIWTPAKGFAQDLVEYLPQIKDKKQAKEALPHTSIMEYVDSRLSKYKKSIIDLITSFIHLGGLQIERIVPNISDKASIDAALDKMNACGNYMYEFPDTRSSNAFKQKYMLLESQILSWYEKSGDESFGEFFGITAHRQGHSGKPSSDPNAQECDATDHQ